MSGWEETQPTRPDWGPRWIRYEGPWLLWVERQGGEWAWGVRSWGDNVAGDAEEAKSLASALLMGEAL
jgi:hypothetical protein